jgi:hypothetical protein
MGSGTNPNNRINSEGIFDQKADKRYGKEKQWRLKKLPAMSHLKKKLD